MVLDFLGVSFYTMNIAIQPRHQILAKNKL